MGLADYLERAGYGDITDNNFNEFYNIQEQTTPASNKAQILAQNKENKLLNLGNVSRSQFYDADTFYQEDDPRRVGDPSGLYPQAPESPNTIFKKYGRSATPEEIAQYETSMKVLDNYAAGVVPASKEAIQDLVASPLTPEDQKLYNQYIKETEMQPMEVTGAEGHTGKWGRQIAQVQGLDQPDTLQERLVQSGIAPELQGGGVETTTKPTEYKPLDLTGAVESRSSIANAVAGFGYMLGEGVLNTLDLVPEIATYAASNLIGEGKDWSDVQGLYTDKDSESFKNWIGYNDQVMNELGTEAAASIKNAWEKGDYWGLADTLWKGVTTPELSLTSLGYVAGMIMPGGMAKAAIKTVSGVNKTAKAMMAADETLSKADAIAKAEDKAGAVYKLTKQMAGQAGYVGEAEQFSREAEALYKQTYNEDMPVEQRVLLRPLGILYAKMDAAAAKAIVLGKDPISKAIPKMVKDLPDQLKATIAGKIAITAGTTAAKAASAFGIEASTEMVQTAMEKIAGKYKTGEVGIGDILEEEKYEIGGAGLLGGAGGVQMAAPSTVGAVLDPITEKVKEASLERTKEKYGEEAEIKVAEQASKIEEAATGQTIEEVYAKEGNLQDILNKREEAQTRVDEINTQMETLEKDSKEYIKLEDTRDRLEMMIERINKAEATYGTEPARVESTVDPVALNIERSTIDTTTPEGEGRAAEIDAELDSMVPEMSERLKQIDQRMDVLSQNEEENIELLGALAEERKGLNDILTTRQTQAQEANIENIIQEGIKSGELDGTNTAELEHVRQLLRETVPKFSASIQDKMQKSNVSLESNLLEPTEGSIKATMVEKGGKKEVFQNVTTVTDQTINDMSLGKNIKSGLDKLTQGKYSSKIQERMMQHLEKGAPVQKTLEKTLKKLQSTMKPDSEAVQKLQSITEDEVSTERMMRAMAIAVSNIYKSIQSERDIQANMGEYGDIDYTRVSNIVTQIGKEYLNSYGQRLSGRNTDINEVYAEIGQTILDAAVANGMVKTEVRSIPLINMVDENGDLITAESKTDLKLVDKDGKTFIEEEVASLIEPEAGTKEESLGRSMDVLMRILRPTNYEVPRAEYDSSIEVPYDRKISKGHLDIIKKMNAMKFNIKPEFVEMLKDLQARRMKRAVSMDTFLRTDPVAKALIGVKTNNTMLTKTSEQGQKLGRSEALARLLDDLEILEGDMYYNYESAINTRIHVMQTVLEFQGDKYMARNLVTGGEYTIDTNTDEGKVRLDVLKEVLADELNVATEDITNLDKPELSKLKEWVNHYNKTGKIFINDMEAVAKDLKISSPYKAASLVKAVAEVNNPVDGIVTSDYMVEFDMSASGVINTLMNLIGDENIEGVDIKEIVDTLREGELDPYKYLNEILEKQKAKDFVELREKLARIDSEINIDSREMAKYVVMTWFYGSSDRNVANSMSHDLAVDIVMSGVEKSNQKAVDMVNEILGSDTYAVDVYPGSNKKAIYNITKDDMTKIEKWLNKNISTKYVDLLSEAFPHVVQYRKTMGEMFKHLERLGWNGEIRTAMDALVPKTTKEKEDGTVYKMRTQKMKAVLHMLADKEGKIEFGGKHIPVNEMLLNENSIKVNPQHAMDAAQLLMTVQHIAEEFGEDLQGIMTVHDAVYGNPELMIAAKARFEELLKEGAVKYDFRDVALQELEDLYNSLDADSKEAETDLKKFIDTQRAVIDASIEAKTKILSNPEFTTNLFGSKTVDVAPTGKMNFDRDAEAVEVETTPEETKPTKEKAKESTAVDKVYQALSKGTNLVEAITGMDVSEKYTAIKDKVITILQEGNLEILKGEEFAGGYGKIWMGDKGAVYEITQKSENPNDVLIKIMAHEIDHAYTYDYIKAELGKKDKAPEIRYIERVLDRLEKHVAKNEHNYEPDIQERLSHILYNETATEENMQAHRISELISVMRNEPKVAETISSILSPVARKTLFNNISRLVDRIVKYVKSLGTDKARKVLTDDAAVTFSKTMLAAEIIAQEGKVREASRTEKVQVEDKLSYSKIKDLEKEFTAAEREMIESCK